MARKRSRQARRLLKIFDKGSTLRKSLKKAMSDKKISKKEIKRLSRKGASLKELQSVRKQATKAKNFRAGGKVDTRKEVKKLYNRTRPSASPSASYFDSLKLQTQVDTPIMGPTPQTGMGPFPPPPPPQAPQAPQAPAGPDKTPDAATMDDRQDIPSLNPNKDPVKNLENLEDSEIGNYAGDLSETLAEQADANNLSIKELRKRMRDPAYRMRVKGIRFADRGTGGLTRSQLTRGGTTGVFGRSGLRIQSLNI